MAAIPGLAGALVSTTISAELEQKRRRDAAEDLRLQQFQADVQLKRQQAEQTRIQNEAAVQQQQFVNQQRQFEFESTQQQRSLEQEASAIRAQKARESSEFIAQQAQRGQTIRTALQQGLSVDPQILEEIGIQEGQLMAAARTQRAAVGTPQIAAGAAPGQALPLGAVQPGTGVISGGDRRFAAGPEGIQMETPALETLQRLEESVARGVQVPPGFVDRVRQEAEAELGSFVGPGAPPPSPPIEEELEDEQKLQAIQDFRDTGRVPEFRLRTLERLRGGMTVNELVNQLEDALPKPNRIQKTLLQSEQEKARKNEQVIQGILDSKNEDVIIFEAGERGLPNREIATREDAVTFMTKKIQRSQIVQRIRETRQGAVPVVTTQAQYDAIPPGGFFEENGRTLQKPE